MAPSAAPSASSSPSATPANGIPAFRHIYVIIMENQEYSSIVGSKQAPYLNSLIARYGLATDFYAETHPSEPNYIALTSGGLQGTNSDGYYNLSAPNLFDQIEAAGKTWHVYAQGYPGGCFAGSVSQSSSTARAPPASMPASTIRRSATRASSTTRPAAPASRTCRVRSRGRRFRVHRPEPDQRHAQQLRRRG